MDELEHLHGELNITQAASAKFDLAVFEIVGDEPFDALAHLLAVLDEIVAFRSGPDERAGHVQIGLRQFAVSCGGARFEQRLELPVLRPLLVIVAV